MIKRILFFAILFTLLIINFGCNKEKNLSISYSMNGVFGENVLALPNSSILNNAASYSLSAELGRKADLKIIITNLSGVGAIWFFTSEDGWSVGDYAGDSQEFISTKDGKIDLDIVFENGPGSCRVDYYENSHSVTQSKKFTW